MKKTGHFQANSITDAIVIDFNRVLKEYGISTDQQIKFFFAIYIHETRLSITEAGWLDVNNVIKNGNDSNQKIEDTFKQASAVVNTGEVNKESDNWEERRERFIEVIEVY